MRPASPALDRLSFQPDLDRPVREVPVCFYYRGKHDPRAVGETQSCQRRIVRRNDVCVAFATFRQYARTTMQIVFNQAIMGGDSQHGVHREYCPTSATRSPRETLRRDLIRQPAPQRRQRLGPIQAAVRCPCQSRESFRRKPLPHFPSTNFIITRLLTRPGASLADGIAQHIAHHRKRIAIVYNSRFTVHGPCAQCLVRYVHPRQPLPNANSPPVRRRSNAPRSSLPPADE